MVSLPLLLSLFAVGLMLLWTLVAEQRRSLYSYLSLFFERDGVCFTFKKPQTQYYLFGYVYIIAYTRHDKFGKETVSHGSVSHHCGHRFDCIPQNSEAYVCAFIPFLFENTP
jgi:hypothetical protein